MLRPPPGPAGRRRAPRLAGLAVLGAVVVPLLVAAPAHAGRRTISDPTHDVVKQVGDHPVKAAVHYRDADVKTFVTTYTQQRLVLSTTVRDLPKNYWAMLWQVQTDAGTQYDLDLLKTGTVRFELSVGNVPVVCEGMTRKTNTVKDKVTVTVPAACLGTPATLRTGAAAAATTRDLGRIYTDDAGRAGAYSNHELQLGKTVRRG